MIDKILVYQNEYVQILEKFDINNSSYDDYIFLFDRIELLLKRNKKVILDFLSLNHNYVYFGGATYFTKSSKELYPLLFSNKKIIIADSIIKMSIFLKNDNDFQFDRIKEIINNSISNILSIKSELQSGFAIMINPYDFIGEMREEIISISQKLTIEYLNASLNTNFNNIDEFIEENKMHSFKELENKYPNINKFYITVNSDNYESLTSKMKNNYVDCGIDENKIKKIVPSAQLILSFCGLFGQAFELKSISIIFNCPLYITRPNVLLYLSCINSIDERDKYRLKITYLLFSLYQYLKDWKLINDNEKIIEFFRKGKSYDELIAIINDKELSIDLYISVINQYLKDNNIDLSSILKKEDLANQC